MLTVYGCYAGLKVRDPVLVGDDELNDTVQYLQKELTGGNLKINRNNHSWVANVLCVDVLEDGKLYKIFNLKA